MPAHASLAGDPVELGADDDVVAPTGATTDGARGGDGGDLFLFDDGGGRRTVVKDREDAIGVDLGVPPTFGDLVVAQREKDVIVKSENEGALVKNADVDGVTAPV